jgi:hypothetical protein
MRALPLNRSSPARRRSWKRRDALLASQPIVTLGLLLIRWLAGFVVGYGLLLWLPGGASLMPCAKRAIGDAGEPRVTGPGTLPAPLRFFLAGCCLPSWAPVSVFDSDSIFDSD